MKHKEFLVKIREKISFLKLIPDKLFFSLDFTEFCLPDDELNMLRKKLEKNLGCYVMTYKSTGSGFKENQLCNILKSAELTEQEKKILQKAEEKARLKKASFGAEYFF